MHDRIDINPRVCGGKPVIKGTRIPVAVVLDQLSTGEPWESILRGFPSLRREDLQAALAFARAMIEQMDFEPAPAASAPHATLSGS